MYVDNAICFLKLDMVSSDSYCDIILYCDVIDYNDVSALWGSDGILLAHLRGSNILEHIYKAKTLIIYCKNNNLWLTFNSKGI